MGLPGLPAGILAALLNENVFHVFPALDFLRA
jgi:hypothetical protein